MHRTARKTREEPVAICPDCRLGHLRSVRDEYEHHFVYEGRKYCVTLHQLSIIRCDRCSEVSLDQGALAVLLEAEYLHLDLLLPREITSARQRIGLSQRKCAQLLGTGIATLSRWEKGHVRQSRSMDNLLRMALEDENCRKHLEDIHLRALHRRRSDSGSRGQRS